MAENRLDSLIVNRLFVQSQADLPESCLTNRNLSPTAAVAASKITQQRVAPFHYGNSDDTAATETFPLAAVVGSAGDLVGFAAGVVVANIGDSEITVDLLKNGVSVLDAPITLDNSQAPREVVAAVLDTPLVELAADDVFEVAIVATAGTGTLGKGVFGRLVYNENAAT